MPDWHAVPTTSYALVPNLYTQVNEPQTSTPLLVIASA